MTTLRTLAANLSDLALHHGDPKLADAALALRAAVAADAAQAAPAVPPGMVLVPLEPTEAMIDATYHSQPLDDIWRDMIAARPQAEQAEGIK